MILHPTFIFLSVFCMVTGVITLCVEYDKLAAHLISFGVISMALAIFCYTNHIGQ